MSTVPTNPPASPIPGAIYVDIATNINYVWTGTGWIPTTGATGYRSQITTGAAILPGFFAKPSPESFVTQVGSQPLNPGDGQIWVDDTVTPNPAYVWHDGGWVKLTDGSFTDTTVAAVPPNSPDLGDTYYETTTGRFYVWDSSNWKVIGETDDTNSIYSSARPSYRSNGNNLQAGDLWINSSSNSLSFWNGGDWIPLSLGGGGGQSTSIVTYATAPAVGVEGDVYYNTTDDILYASDGSSWVAISGSSGSTPQATSTSFGTVKGDTRGGNTFYGADAGQLFGFDGISNQNTLIGAQAGQNMVSGLWNTAVGNKALFTHTGGNRNVAIGTEAARDYPSGNGITAIGAYALQLATQGYNTAVGVEAGELMVTGTGNTILGSYRGVDGQNDTVTIARSNSAGGVVFQVNENNAWGVPNYDASTGIPSYISVDFGLAGQVLTSQGPTASPQWTTVSGGSSGSATPTVQGIVFGSTPIASDTSLGWGAEIAGDNYNTYIGSQSGIGNTLNRGNDTHIGTFAGEGYSGGDNVNLGSWAGRNTVGGIGNYNVHIGARSALNNSGDYNVIIGADSATSLTGFGNIRIGTRVAGGGADGSLIIGGHVSNVDSNEALITYGYDNVTVAGSPRTNLVLISGNEFGAWGIWDGSFPLDPATYQRYGTSGQVLTSQGTNAPPQWTTVSTPRNIGVSTNVQISSTGFSATSDIVTLLSSVDTTIPITPPTAGTIPDGSYIKIIAQQSGTAITFSNNAGGTNNFMGGGTTYVWTPAFVGQTATVIYYEDIVNNGFGYVVELSSN